jgi:multimeric flavodoxin WrbA
MNIAIINGSYKKNGITSSVLKEIMKIMSDKPDVNITYINLSEYNIAYCTGCTICYSEGFCPLDRKDNFNEIREIIKNSDGVILSSPNYVSSVTGIFKTFIDRMDFVTGQALHNKYVFTVTTYQQIRGHLVNKYIKEQSILAGGKVRSSLVIKKDPYAAPIELGENKGKIKKATEKFYRSIVSKSKKNFVEKIYTRVLIFIFKKGFSGLNSNRLTAQINNWHEKGLIK